MFKNRPAVQANQTQKETKSSSSQLESTPAEYYGIRDSVQQALLSRNEKDSFSAEPDQLAKVIEEVFDQYCRDNNILYSSVQRTRALNWVVSDITSYGPLDPLLKDPTITEIMVNGPKTVFVEKAGKIEEVEVSFEDETHLRRIIDRIVAPIGRRVDESSPMVDARLPNGYRVNATIPPLSLDGPILTIRKFAEKPYTPDDLVANGTINADVMEFLKDCVESRINLVISGGTGSGKTTFLNTLSFYIPARERVITIEDSAELQLVQTHVVRLEKRPPNIEGQGEITIRQLVINALRMRPDRIIVGESRGGEAFDMLQAMNTGHDGSMTTIHANSSKDAVRRVESMVMMAGVELPLIAIREQIASAVELIIHLERLPDGSRRVMRVTEVQDMEGELIVLNDLFVFQQERGDGARIIGTLVPTGVVPSYEEKFRINQKKIQKNLFVKKK